MCQIFDPAWLLSLFILQPTEAHAKEHYLDLKDLPFYPSLCKYLASGPVVAMVITVFIRLSDQASSELRPFLGVLLEVIVLLAEAILRV